MSKKYIWILGIIIGLGSMISLEFLSLDKPISIIIRISAIAVFSISFVMLNFNRQMKINKEYRISVTDERNIRIREKTSDTIAPIFMLLFGVQAIYGIAYEFYVIAIFNSIVVILSPIVMILISKYYEKKL